MLCTASFRRGRIGRRFREQNFFRNNATFSAFMILRKKFSNPADNMTKIGFNYIVMITRNAALKLE